jgi:hypothetical protein
MGTSTIVEPARRAPTDRAATNAAAANNSIATSLPMNAAHAANRLEPPPAPRLGMTSKTRLVIANSAIA